MQNRFNTGKTNTKSELTTTPSVHDLCTHGVHLVYTGKSVHLLCTHPNQYTQCTHRECQRAGCTCVHCFMDLKHSVMPSSLVDWLIYTYSKCLRAATRWSKDGLQQKKKKKLQPPIFHLVVTQNSHRWKSFSTRALYFTTWQCIGEFWWWNSGEYLVNYACWIIIVCNPPPSSSHPFSSTQNTAFSGQQLPDDIIPNQIFKEFFQ